MREAMPLRTPCLAELALEGHRRRRRPVLCDRPDRMALPAIGHRCEGSIEPSREIKGIGLNPF
jgi:hypothetical protein